MKLFLDIFVLGMYSSFMNRAFSTYASVATEVQDQLTLPPATQNILNTWLFYSNGSSQVTTLNKGNKRNIWRSKIGDDL